ncbi:hypothetical protein YC2023_114885 [Brassica napus]
MSSFQGSIEIDSVVTSFDPNPPLKGSTSTSYTTQKPCKESSRLLDLLPGNYTLNSFKNQHYSRKLAVFGDKKNSDIRFDWERFQK